MLLFRNAFKWRTCKSISNLPIVNSSYPEALVILNERYNASSYKKVQPCQNSLAKLNNSLFIVEASSVESRLRRGLKKKLYSKGN